MSVSSWNLPPLDPPADSRSLLSCGKTNPSLFSLCVGLSPLFYQLLSGRGGLRFIGITQNPPTPHIHRHTHTHTHTETHTDTHTHTVSPQPHCIPPGTHYDQRAIFVQRLLESTVNAKGDGNGRTIGAMGARAVSHTLSCESWPWSTGHSHHAFFTVNAIGPQTRIS